MGRARLIRGICKLADYRESRYVVFLLAAKGGERNNTRANETAKECCVCPAWQSSEPRMNNSSIKKAFVEE